MRKNKVKKIVDLPMQNIGETFLFPKPHSLEDGVKSDINACGVTVSVWERKNESKIKS